MDLHSSQVKFVLRVKKKNPPTFPFKALKYTARSDLLSTGRADSHQNLDSVPRQKLTDKTQSDCTHMQCSVAME